MLAAAAAFSVGIGLEVNVLTGQTELSPRAAAFAVAIPIAVFLLGIWFVAIRKVGDRVVDAVLLAAVALVLVDPLLPSSVLVTCAALVAVVVVLVVRPCLDSGDD